jgi:hypothetical protein
MLSPCPKVAAAPVTILTAVVLMPAVAACHSEKAAAAQVTIDACTLLSASQAAKILGAEVTSKPVDTSGAGPDAASICHYQTHQVRGGFTLLAGRVQYADPAAEMADRKKAEVSDLPPGIPTPTFSDVTGLGEAAYLAETPESVELHVLDHDAVIVVTLVRKPDPAAEDLAERLGRAAVQNLAAR